MTREIQGYYILGFTINGGKFRPSDWVERMASVFGEFGSERHLIYDSMIKPTRFENDKCLYIDYQLSGDKPEIFNFIMDFARMNSLKIVEKKLSMMDILPETSKQEAA